MPLRRIGHQRESWARSADGLLLAARVRLLRRGWRVLRCAHEGAHAQVAALQTRLEMQTAASPAEARRANVLGGGGAAVPGTVQAAP